MVSMKILLLGCGRWGTLILKELVSMNITVDVVDPASSALSIADIHGARCGYKSFPSVGDWNGIIVATPASSHYTDTLAACQYNLPLFIEKPMTVTGTTARELCEVEQPKIFVMHTWRYHPAVEKLAEMILTKELGSLCAIHSIRANWTSPRIDVDPVWTLLPHDLSILLEFFGVMPSLVSAEAEFHGKKVVGLKCHLEINGIKIWITVSARQIEKQRELQLHFDHGVAVMPDDRQGCIYVLKNEQLAQQVEKTYYSCDVSALTNELRVFCNYLGGGVEPKCSALTGLTIINTVEKIRALAGISE